ncbi:DMT family transporter [Tumebacillus permanentifrigoris]|uniref:Drug/metabolite transporter (DMT)-like permease n=1 Tax=Tumebacillus permanentifrigoris TaxID=378543 RepID=A0A316DCA1_9BACL|nr:DMT family transporter [Tumebacillus permanentifrigoris]PWK15831.1 drug/metabolite transporter (DMT)-like permease [Tumebacillus permanentifrigoris]
MKKSYMADLILLGVTFSWGATFVLVKEAIQTMPPFTFLAVRFLFAALLLFLFMFFFARDTLRGLDRRIWIGGVILGFWLFAGYAFQTFGLQFTTSSKAGFITGLSVVFVPFLSLWMLGHTLKRNALLGAGIATVGLAMLSLTSELSVNIGDLLVFLCALSYALHITLVGKYAPRFQAFPLALLQIFFCGVFNLGGALVFEDVSVVFAPDVLFDPWVFSALLICSVFATAVAFVAQNQFQKFTSPARTALIFATEPVFAAATGYFWAGDRLTILQVSGCLLILGGMLFAELGGQDDKPDPELLPT